MNQNYEYPPTGQNTASQGSGALKIVLIILGVILVIGLIGCGLLAALLVPAISAAREAAHQAMASNNLKQIGLALHNYEAAFKAMPAAQGENSQNEATLSWRVSLLAFVDYERGSELHKRVDWGKPWDAPENSFLLDSMPAVFRSPLAPSGQPAGHTNIFTIRHPNSAFPGPGVYSKLRDVTDGTSNTLMAVQLPTRSISWTKPDDITLDEALAEIRASEHPEKIQLIYLDGAVREFGEMTDEDFAAAVTKDQAEPLIPLGGSVGGLGETMEEDFALPQ